MDGSTDNIYVGNIGASAESGTIPVPEHRERGWCEESKRRASRRNEQRLLEPLGYVPPAEFEAIYHERKKTPVMVA